MGRLESVLATGWSLYGEVAGKYAGWYDTFRNLYWIRRGVYYERLLEATAWSSRLEAFQCIFLAAKEVNGSQYNTSHSVPDFRAPPCVVYFLRFERLIVITIYDMFICYVSLAHLPLPCAIGSLGRQVANNHFYSISFERPENSL